MLPSKSRLQNRRCYVILIIACLVPRPLQLRQQNLDSSFIDAYDAVKISKKCGRRNGELFRVKNGHFFGDKHSFPALPLWLETLPTLMVP